MSEEEMATRVLCAMTANPHFLASMEPGVEPAHLAVVWIRQLQAELKKTRPQAPSYPRPEFP